MKNFKLLIGTLLLVVLMVSCKKDATDERDKFIGSYTGTFSLLGPALNSSSSVVQTLTIAKGSANISQITLTHAGSTVIPTAAVSGSTYKYDEYTVTSTANNITVTMKLNGTGSLSGTSLAETGTIVYTLAGVDYPGTWSSALIKQ